MQSPQSTVDVSKSLTDALKGRVLESILVGVDGNFSIRCLDGTVASLAVTRSFSSLVNFTQSAGAPVPCLHCIPVPNSALTPDDFRPKLPPMLADLLLQAELPLAEPEQEKPPAQMVTIPSGIDATAQFGMTRRMGGVDWEKVLTLPTFQMFVDESGFSNPNGLDSQNLAIAFIQHGISSGKSEAQFYGEYVDWFESKGCWKNETPTGGVKNG